uniref:Ribonuclease 3 n=1 Tax=Candidatus Kentrum sp. MB TaxID=2138164 RepID=A0A450XQY8_9GAMM|nr:MAG: RNAse III [Candidatus Kentron sp. MB]VFK75607.1 MAG: RNAse III [Candidatus Kentron sp. MB]
MFGSHIKTKSLQRLFPLIDYTFSDTSLLVLALTHRSASAEHNERLEFLGDAILGFVTAGILFDHFPNSSEGELTRLRARLVRRQTLAEIARQLELGQHLILGGGEIKSGGDDRESTLANAVEAIIGAVYLDGGLEPCRQSILHIFRSRLEAISQQKVEKDAKTKLQELLQGMHLSLPEYQVIEATGSDHEHWFTVECRAELFSVTTQGSGGTRRIAEQNAAQQALQHINRKRQSQRGS